MDVGSPVSVVGTAADVGGGVVGAVEVSVDGGNTWHPAAGRENWTYAFTPIATGRVNIRSRAVDDSGNLEMPSAGIPVTVQPVPPAISAVQAGPISSSWAVITWTTDQPADTQVDYGTTTAYGGSTPLDTTLVSNHSAVLDALMPSTIYHYRVKSRNAPGGLAISSDSTFITTAPGSALVITFNDLTGNQALDGQYPTGVVDWGSGVWWVFPASGAFPDNNISFNGPSILSGTFTFLRRLRLRTLDAYNFGPDSTTLTLSCPGQLNAQATLAAGQLATIATGWTDACSPVTISNPNGWNSNFDNLVVDSPPPH